MDTYIYYTHENKFETDDWSSIPWRKLHRLDGPAVIYSNGHQEWRIEGKIHREEGPAIITNGYQEWWIESKRHRLDGPAVIRNNGEFWYKDGEKHRVDGPAIDLINGHQEWWIEGKIIKRKEVDGYTVYYYKGNEKKLHRDPLEGPAVIYPDGRCEYWVKGKQIINSPLLGNKP